MENSGAKKKREREKVNERDCKIGFTVINALKDMNNIHRERNEI